MSKSYVKYINELRKAKYNPLLPREERALGRRAQKGDIKARNELVQHNLRYVIRVAEEYLSQGAVPIDDLVSAGNQGLIKAAEKYSNFDIKFISYATWWVRQAILQLINHMSRIYRPPDHVCATICKLNKLPDDLSADHICALIGRTKFEVEHAIKVRDARIIRFDSESAGDNAGGCGTGKKTAFINRFVNEYDDSSASDDAYKGALTRYINDVLSEFTEREQDIINMHFGLGEYVSPSSLRTIGRKHGLTYERVRQIQSKVIRLMRKRCSKLSNYLND